MGFVNDFMKNELNRAKGKQALYNNLAISEDDINSMINDFLTSFRTDQATQRNQITAAAARDDLPGDVTSAQLRGADINNARGLQSGVNSLKLAGKNSRIDAAKFLAQLDFQREMAKMNRDAQKDSQIFGAIGQAAFTLPFLL